MAGAGVPNLKYLILNQDFLLHRTTANQRSPLNRPALSPGQVGSREGQNAPSGLR